MAKEQTAFKLNYRIVGDGPRALGGKPDQFGLDYWDIEWTHAEGFPEDSVVVPVTHPPDIKYETRKSGKRSVIKDQITVPCGAPKSVVMQALEEKRQSLATALGVSV